MHAKRCAILAACTGDGTAIIRRKVDQDLRRYLVVEGATLFFGHGSRDIVANVIVTGIDIDAMLPDLEALDTVLANLEISEDGQYRATLMALPGLPPYHRHRATV